MYTPWWLGGAGARAGLRVSLCGLALTVLGAAAPAWAQVAEVPALARATQRTPGDPAGWRALGEAQLHAGQYREARTSFALAARLSRNNAGALYDRARVDMAAGDYHDARNSCRKLKRAHPGDALGDLCEAQAFLIYRRASRALPLLEEVIAREPSQVLAQLLLGEARRMQGAAAQAEAAYRAVLAAPDARRFQRVQAQRGLAHLALLAGDQARALKLAEAALAEDEADPETHYLVAMLSSPESALVHLRRARAIRPDYALAELAEGRTLVVLGQNAEAERALRRTLREQPPLAQGIYTPLGTALLGLDRLSEAEEMLLKAIEGAPQDAEAVLGLSRIYARTDRIEQALAHYQRAGSMRRQDPIPYVEAAQLALQAGRRSLAVGYARRAVERDPQGVQTYVLLAEGLLQIGDRKGARDAYQTALSFSPNDSQLRGKLDSVQP